MTDNKVVNYIMWFLHVLRVKSFRRRADTFLKKFPIFFISIKEFLTRCLVLEQNFAGIVLGYPRSNITVKIIAINNVEDVSDEKSLPMGYFGEIVYKIDEIWYKTNVCGFTDQCSRIWCCGDINNIVHFNGEDFFPYCIEPVFETLIFVKQATLCANKTGYPVLKVKLKKFFHFGCLRKFFIKNLYSFARKFEKTKNILIEII